MAHDHHHDVASMGDNPSIDGGFPDASLAWLVVFGCDPQQFFGCCAFFIGLDHEAGCYVGR